jgi:hypothetical protein
MSHVNQELVLHVLPFCMCVRYDNIELCTLMKFALLVWFLFNCHNLSKCTANVTISIKKVNHAPPEYHLVLFFLGAAVSTDSLR